MFDGACLNWLYKSKKFFRDTMRILKSKIRSWSLPQIIINYCIIIDAYYDYILHTYIYNTSLLEEYDKEEIVEVTELATICCFKRGLYKVLSNITYSPSRPATQREISSQHSAPIPNCVKMFLSWYFLVAMAINIQSLYSQTCVYIHMFFTIQRRFPGKRNKKKSGQQWMPPAKEIFPRAIGHACLRFISPVQRH
jgi:hypothetical protein